MVPAGKLVHCFVLIALMRCRSLTAALHQQRRPSDQQMQQQEEEQYQERRRQQQQLEPQDYHQQQHGGQWMGGMGPMDGQGEYGMPFWRSRQRGAEKLAVAEVEHMGSLRPDWHRPAMTPVRRTHHA